MRTIAPGLRAPCGKPSRITRFGLFDKYCPKLMLICVTCQNSFTSANPENGISIPQHRASGSMQFPVEQRPGLVSRRWLFAAAALVPSVSMTRFARSAPAGRNARIVIPYPAGSALDVIARTVMDMTSGKWNRSIVLEHKPGANSNIGTELVSKSEPDGSTLLLTSMAIAVNQYLYPSLSWAPDDLKPLSIVCKVPNVLMVPAGAPYQTLNEFVEFARSNPGKLTYGSAGVGSSFHLCAELFMRATGTTLLHVPYRGSNHALQDLIGNVIDVAFGNVASSLGSIQSGSVRALAVTSLDRVHLLKGVPTVAEAAVPGFEMAAWYGFFSSGKTPEPILESLSADIRSALADPAVVHQFQNELGMQMTNMDRRQSDEFLRAERRKWLNIIRDREIKL